MNSLLPIVFLFFTGFSQALWAQADSALKLLLQTEIRKNHQVLLAADSLSPYFIAYRINDTLSLQYSVNKGAVIQDKQSESRALNVEVRVGDHHFDNTHPMRDNLDFNFLTGYQNVPLPLEGDGAVVRRNLRIATDYGYRAARDQFSKIKANFDVRPSSGRDGLDFASQAPSLDWRPESPPAIQRDGLDSLYERLRSASKKFQGQKHLYASQIDFNYTKVRKRLVNTEGTAVAQDEHIGNIGIYVETKAEDGMIVWLSRQFFFRDNPVNLPVDSLEQLLEGLVRRLDTLRTAPVLDTYAGPVILENVAAAVFLHEVFGHRVEGHRQKAVDEGQTFVSKIGEAITNPGVSVEDNPGIQHLHGEPLNGHYLYDDEGVTGQRVQLIEKGVFRNFLLGRSVLSDSGQSNGHGRGSLGLLPVARMGNTILTADKTVPRPALRDSLIALLRRTGKPYGLLVHDISGGFTYTGRDLPQSFRVEPLYLTQIFADGKPDRVVRGADLVGTPLVSLGQIRLAGDDPAVFNGYCGAESGWIPVSSISPSLLLGSMEFETRSKDQNKPPYLPPPALRRQGGRQP